MELLDKQLQSNAPMNREEIILQYVNEWLSSDTRAEMLKAQDYYEVKNDVLSKQRMVIGRSGQLEPVKNIADNRIANAFLPDLVDQKVQYLLGKTWSVETDNEQYQEELSDIFDDEFQSLMRRVGRDAVNKGIGWIHTYIDSDGKLKFKRMQPEEIIPLWTDIDHTVLQGVIRVYDVVEYQARDKKIITYVDVYDNTGVRHYKYNSNALDIQGEEDMIYDIDHNGYNWQQIPFVCVKYNDLEIPLLRRIKTLVDEYDDSLSRDANLLEDEPNGITVVKNYDGTDPGELRSYLKNYRVIKISNDGDVKQLTTTPDIASSTAHKETIKRNIYTFGRGVDMNASIGANASAEARQYLYAGLDMDCNQLEQGVKDCLNGLLWFISNNPNNPVQAQEKVSFVFNRDILINETQAIEMVLKAQAVDGVSRETIVSNMPWVSDAKEEIAKWEEEQSNELFKFENIDTMPAE